MDKPGVCHKIEPCIKLLCFLCFADLFLLLCEPRWLLSAAAVALAWFDDVTQREILGHIIGLGGTVQVRRTT